jgi:hypothetical protein
MDKLAPGTLLLHSITPEEFYAQIRVIVKQELQQDQLLTKEGMMLPFIRTGKAVC